MAEIRTYKYRIYPSQKQKQKLFNQFKVCKEVFNILLEESKELKTTNKFDFNSLIGDIKTTAPAYYSQVHSQVLQNVSDRLQKSFAHFFRRIKERKRGKNSKAAKAGYPRFKSRIRSMTYPQSGFNISNQRTLYASKIGNIPIVLHRMPKGKIKTMAMKVNPAGQWFACFSCGIETKKAKYDLSNAFNNTIGIDVGIENFATLSNRKTIQNPRYLITSEGKLKKLQRNLSNKMKKSNNRCKARINLARRHVKITNQRNDFLHKLSSHLTKVYSIIAVENLNIKGMVQNHRLSKHIYDASWNKFISFLEYKAFTSGGKLIKVDPRNTSKTCSNCGNIEEMPLHKRTFECSICGLVLHRDHNAAIDIQGRAGQARTNTPAEILPLLSLKKASGINETGTTRGEIDAGSSTL